MAALADRYQVVAIDQRGYNLSDKPKGVENYDMRLLVADVAAVIRHLGRDKATIVGHDWGGIVACDLRDDAAADRPENLISLHLPHPTALSRELRTQQGSDRQTANTPRVNFRPSRVRTRTVFVGRPMTP
jgi:pimeloyl-ACP methyl ester carboxylesterase